jgi:hypothetical protein
MDERRRYFQRLGRLRRSAKRWSVAAATFGGAAAVLLPHAGVGAADAVWTALFGGSAALAAWRWSDARTLAAEPAPPELDPATQAQLNRARIEHALASLPGGTAVLQHAERQRLRLRLRGTEILPGWIRLDRASEAMAALSARALGGPVDMAALEATVAERALRAVGERAALVERANRLGHGRRSSPGAAAPAGTHQQLAAHFSEGVAAYESLVKAAAGYLAADGQAELDSRLVQRLSEETQRLHEVTNRIADVPA